MHTNRLYMTMTPPIPAWFVCFCCVYVVFLLCFCCVSDVLLMCFWCLSYGGPKVQITTRISKPNNNKSKTTTTNLKTRHPNQKTKQLLCLMCCCCVRPGRVWLLALYGLYKVYMGSQLLAGNTAVLCFVHSVFIIIIHTPTPPLSYWHTSWLSSVTLNTVSYGPCVVLGFTTGSREVTRSVIESFRVAVGVITQGEWRNYF